MASSILDITEILNSYSDDIQESITNEVIQRAKDGKKALEATSPKNKGKYAKGWRVKTTKGSNYISCTIHNATDYQLTHLLEKGHLTRNGKKTKAIVHIKPVEETCIKEYEKNVEKIIKTGG